MPELLQLATEAAMESFGAKLVQSLRVGDIVLLSGPLGAGKTTLARAMLHGLGWTEVVRSPTYNLIHTYATNPPVMHADLFRVESAADLGLEEFFDTHLCLIEWPDRLMGVLDGRQHVYEIDIAFGEDPTSRRIKPSHF